MAILRRTTIGEGMIGITFKRPDRGTFLRPGTEWRMRRDIFGPNRPRGSTVACQLDSGTCDDRTWGGQALRTLGVNASRFETYFEARPEYAREEGRVMRLIRF